jgi:hypothetical protein
MPAPKLKLIENANLLHEMGPSSNVLPEADPRQDGLPDGMDLARWRTRAEAHMEDALTRFDHRLLEGTSPSSAAMEATEAFMAWTRGSVAEFVTEKGSRLSSAALRGEELQHWVQMGERAAARADADPAGVDRFLRVWLAVVHEATATGFASLYALEP